MSLANRDNTAVIVPIYNGQEYLEELFGKISVYIPINQIIAVDDGSTDKSALICSKCGVHLIKLSKNQGKGTALKAGFREAIKRGFEFAFTIDSDLQHDPAYIPRFFRKQNMIMADLLIGKRDFSLNKMPATRILSNRLTSLMTSIMAGKTIYDSQCGYRLYRLEKVKHLKLESKRYQFETEIILAMSKKISIIDYVTISTVYNGETSYISHVRDIKNFIKVILKYF